MIEMITTPKFIKDPLNDPQLIQSTTNISVYVSILQYSKRNC